MKFIYLLLGLFFFVSAAPSYAHSFGQQYTLPVPFWLYAYGAAAAVIISFIIIGIFFNQNRKEIKFKTLDISKWKLIVFFSNPVTLAVLKTVSVLLFLFTILTGLIGTDSPTQNFNMTFFWIIFLLGTTYLSAIFGNIYNVINPWKIIVELAEKIFGEEAEGKLYYPKALSYYPALIFYFSVIWIELVGKFYPFQLSLALVNYSFLTFLGVYLFGKKDWFAYGEFFSVFYGLIGKMSVIYHRNKKFYLRPPFVGLLEDYAPSFSLLLFILFILSSTSFDGFQETTPWWNFYFSTAQIFQQIFGNNSLTAINTLGLFFSLVFFLAIYLILITAAKLVIGTKSSIKDIALKFSYCLLPIGLVYNISHYYTFLLIQGQGIIALISDPFGFGWNIFGTNSFLPNITIISTNVIWHSQVFFILLGHITAVFLSHIVALRVSPSHRKAVLSQFPMLILMVFYTILGLWILSQPLSSGL